METLIPPYKKCVSVLVLCQKLRQLIVFTSCFRKYLRPVEDCRVGRTPTLVLILLFFLTKPGAGHIIYYI